MASPIGVNSAHEVFSGEDLSAKVASSSSSSSSSSSGAGVGMGGKTPSPAEQSGMTTSTERCSSPLSRRELGEPAAVQEDLYSPTTNAAHILAMVSNSSWASQTLSTEPPAGVSGGMDMGMCGMGGLSDMGSFSPGMRGRKRASTIGGDGLNHGARPYFDGTGMFPMQTLTWLASMQDDEVSVAQSLFELGSGVKAPPVSLREEHVQPHASLVRSMYLSVRTLLGDRLRFTHDI
jgi:hypothetical protein